MAERGNWEDRALENLFGDDQPKRLRLHTGGVPARPADNRLQELLARAAEDDLMERYQTDPVFAEDVNSLAETRDYVTYPDLMSRPQPCEVCGTGLTIVPERSASVPADTEPTPALWEVTLWRKHTPRRCQAMRRLADG
jgi:hypothetical protein